MANITEIMFNKQHSPQYDFKTLVIWRMKSGDWTIEELALTIKNTWLAGQDMRYEEVLADIKSVL